MNSETCPKCGGSLRFNPNVGLGRVATDYDNCHAFCDVCRIGISNSHDPEQRTYICKTLADNLADPQSGDRYLRVMEHALNQRNRKNKIRRARFEKSEDTPTWSVFSHLENLGLMAAAARALTSVAWNDPVDVLYWGYNDQGPETLREWLITLLKGLGENAKSLSEPDLILHAPRIGLAFVEAKYASSNRPRFEGEKAKRYLDAGANHLQPNCDGIQHYELLRNWVIGCRLAAELDLPFWLINLVRRGEEANIEHDFGQFLRQDERHRFHRAEWEELFEALHPMLTQPGDEAFWRYIRTRTIHFRPAFGHR
jgi:hypothetical protein